MARRFTFKGFGSPSAVIEATARGEITTSPSERRLYMATLRGPSSIALNGGSMDPILAMSGTQFAVEVAEEVFERLYGMVTGADAELDFPGGVSGKRLYSPGNKAKSQHTGKEFVGQAKLTMGPNEGKLVTAQERAAFSDGVWVGYRRCAGWFKLQMKTGRLKWQGDDNDLDTFLKMAAALK